MRHIIIKATFISPRREMKIEWKTTWTQQGHGRTSGQVTIGGYQHDGGRMGCGYSICRVGSASELTFRSSLPREPTIELSAYHNPDYGLLNGLSKPFNPPFFLTKLPTSNYDTMKAWLRVTSLRRITNFVIQLDQALSAV